jgi:hypothetical protein
MFSAEKKIPHLPFEYLHTLGFSAYSILLYARQLLRSGFANTVVNQISQAAKISHIHPYPPPTSPPPPTHPDPLNIFPLLADRPAHRRNTLERISLYSRDPISF